MSKLEKMIAEVDKAYAGKEMPSMLAASPSHLPGMRCNYCCQTSSEEKYRDDVAHRYHAMTQEGKTICDTCYTYDLCKGRCNEDCIHVPFLSGAWVSDSEK